MVLSRLRAPGLAVTEVLEGKAREVMRSLFPVKDEPRPLSPGRVPWKAELVTP